MTNNMRGRGEPAERRLEMAQAYQRLFMTELGQLILDDIAKFAHGDATTVKTKPDGSICPHASLVAGGRREVFLWIKQRIETDISAIHEFMMKESLKDDTE